MGVRVRPAEPSDAEALAELSALLTGEDSGGLSRLKAADVLEHCFGDRPSFQALVAEEDERLLGYASFFPAYDTQYAAKGLYLQDLFVRREARRRGIGRALMVALSRICLEEGGCYLVWNALPSNRAGRAFYRALGARTERVITLSLQPGPLRRLAVEDEDEARRGPVPLVPGGGRD